MTIGRLGAHSFKSGFYVYTGRDARAPEKRIRRHVSGTKRCRWHIDYLTSDSDARYVESVIHRSPPESECRINQKIQNMSGAKAVIPGFGSSDCREGCGSHLVYFRKRPRLRSYAIR